MPNYSPQPRGRRVDRQEIDRTAARVAGLYFHPGDFNVVDSGVNGAAVHLRNPPAPARAAFEVYKIAKDKIAVKGGYRQGQTGALTSVSDVASITVSANLEVFARYDLGLAGTSTPAWEVVSSTVIQTVSALPTFAARYLVVPIATVTVAGTAISQITQHHAGNLLCPDMEPALMVKPWGGTVANIPPGYALCDGADGRPDLRGRFIMGGAVDTADGTHTRAVGASGGTKYAIPDDHTHAFDTAFDDDLYFLDGTVTIDVNTWRFPKLEDGTDTATGAAFPFYVLAYICHL